MNEQLNNNQRKDEVKTNSTETVPDTKMKILGRYMLDTLKEMYQSLRYPEFKFAVSGIVISIILILISVSFFILPVINNNQPMQLATIVIPLNPIGILISIIVAAVVIYLWFLLGLKVTPSAAHYLVDNKVLKLVFTRGDVHYIEYVPPEKRKIALPSDIK